MAVVGAPCSCGKTSPDPGMGGPGGRCRNSDHCWRVKCTSCGHTWLWVYGDRCIKCLTWTPDASSNEHLVEIRAQVSNPDAARPVDVITPILYMKPSVQYMGWDLASAWLREKRVRFSVGSTGDGWFILAVLWFPDRVSGIKFDFRLGHTLAHSPDRVAAQILNLRIVSGLPILTQAHQIQDPPEDPNDPGRQPWILVDRVERLTPLQVAWNDAQYPSRDLPWNIYPSLGPIDQLPGRARKDGYPFNYSLFRKRRDGRRIDGVQFEGNLGWFHKESRPRLKEVLLDYAKYLEPLRTSPPWAPWV